MPKIIKNPSTADIKDFEIEEPHLVDDEGNIIQEQKIGDFKNEGNTELVNDDNLFYATSNVYKRKSNKWSLLAGEEKSFPNYVCDYLKKVYPFLEIVK